MKGKVNCTCGWSWNKSDSSSKDMYICHECGRDNSNNMKNGGWLDNYGTQANYNDSKATASPDMRGDGFSNVGRNYSPAWGGQFQTGGKLKFLQPTSDKLPEGYRIPYDTPSTERASSIGGTDGEPAYLVPEFKYGQPIYDSIEEFKRTGEHLGGPFKTWQEAEEWENTVRHPAVENRETIMFPQEKFQTGGSLPGSVGFTYARTKGIPSNGPYAKKTLASAQNGVDMYDNPIIAEENYIKGAGRSNYKPRTNISNLYDLDPRYNHTRAHENYHARQFAEGRSNFDIGHNTENALWAAMQKRPEITSTEEVFDSFHNRKQKEMEMDRPDMVNIVPETRFMPSRLIDKYIDRNGLQYRNPNSMEGEAEYYGDLGEEYYKIPKGQNGMEMKYYQNGLDFKPKSISRDGGWLNKYEQAQEGKKVKFDPKKFAADKKRNTPLQQSIDKESNSEDNRRWTDSKEYKDAVKANKLAENKAILDDRKNRINKSMAAQKKSFTKDNWRQQLADETQATGDKLRIFPEDPDSFIDEWLNPGVMIGNMASDLGSAPLRAQQENSYMPYVTSIGVPLLTGGLEGIGAKSNKQFVNNLVNPINIVPGYKSAEKFIAPKIKKTLAKGALKTLEGVKRLETLGKEAVKGLDDTVIYPIKYRKQIADIKKLHSGLASELGSDEAVKRLSGVLGIKPTNLNYPSITTHPRIGSHFDPVSNNINMDFRQINQFKNSDEIMLSPETVHGHEVGHWMQKEAYKDSPDYARDLDNYQKELAEYEKQLSLYNSPENQSLSNINLSNATQEELQTWIKNFVTKPYKPLKPFVTSKPTVIDRFAKNLYEYDPNKNFINIGNVDHVNKGLNINTIADNAEYFTHRGVEPLAHLREMRQNMLNKGYIKDKYEPISEETINKFISENPTDRVSSFTSPDSPQTKGLETIFRNLPSVVGAGAVGTGAAYQMQDEESLPEMRKGGIVKDDRGQWDHPGEITEIGSNQITMQGVPYPVLGISNTGDAQMMYPNGEYEYDGESVTEFPMAQNGSKLDFNNLPKVSEFKKKPLKLKSEKNNVVKESTKVNKNTPTKVKQKKQFKPLDDTELAKLNIPEQVTDQISHNIYWGNDKQNYGIIDKENNVMYYVNPEGKIIGSENVITGATNKDEENAPSMLEYGKTANEYYDYLKNTNQRVTPAGVFTLHSNKNDSYGKPHSLIDRVIGSLPFVDDVKLNTLDDPSLMHAIYNEMPWREEEKKEYYDHRKESYGPTGNMFRMVSQYGVPSSKGMHGTGNTNRIAALNSASADKNLSNGCINVGGKTICNDILKDKSKLYILPEVPLKYTFDDGSVMEEKGRTNIKEQMYTMFGHYDDDEQWKYDKDKPISREYIQSAKATKNKVTDIIRNNKIKATPEEIDFVAAVAQKETKGGKSFLSQAESILPGFSSYGLYEQKEDFPFLKGKSPNDEVASTQAVIDFYRSMMSKHPELEYEDYGPEKIYSTYTSGKEDWNDTGIYYGPEFRKSLQAVKGYKNGGNINQQDQKTLEHLDQLTNFTNYNKQQPAGWLSKYN